MKRVSARAIIIENNKLLVMFRRKIKDGIIKEYYAILGGGVEENETPEETVKRELMEEANIKIGILGYLGTYEDENSIQHYYHCCIKEGTPVLGGEEKERMTENNYYELRFESINNLHSLGLVCEDKVINALNRKYE